MSDLDDEFIEDWIMSLLKINFDDELVEDEIMALS